MSNMKPSAILSGVAVAIAAVVGVASVGMGQVAKPQTVQTGPDAANKAPVDRADRSDSRVTSGRDVHVDAPHTSVDVGKDTGKVRVRAPHTDVKVDPQRGQVRVKAPYVDLNIRW
jgi:hypothetical protein